MAKRITEKANNKEINNKWQKLIALMEIPGSTITHLFTPDMSNKNYIYSGDGKAPQRFVTLEELIKIVEVKSPVKLGARK